jgi:hypothetical protein
MVQDNFIDSIRPYPQTTSAASSPKPGRSLHQTEQRSLVRLFLLGLTVTLGAGCDSAPANAGAAGTGGANTSSGGASAGGHGTNVTLSSHRPNALEPTKLN